MVQLVGSIKPMVLMVFGTISKGHQHPPKAAIRLAAMMFAIIRISSLSITLSRKMLKPAIEALKTRAMTKRPPKEQPRY